MSDGTLALHGGAPVRDTLLPYGRQIVDEDDVAAVVAALRSGWLTTGPAVERFEADLCAVGGAAHAVAVSHGTAALHLMLAALGLGPGDEVIVPTLTFAATANAALYLGATPVFADVCPGTLLVDPASVEAHVTPRTRAVVGVDFAGQPCDWPALRAVADRHGLALLADGAHALGATLAGRPVGSLADLTALSFHPVKHATTGEGGAVLTDDPVLAARVARLRNHGISRTFAERAAAGTWEYRVVELGYNYRLTDLQCALGSSQLRKLPRFLARRREVAAAFLGWLRDRDDVVPQALLPDREHAWHIFPVRWRLREPDRAWAFAALRAEGIGVNVHYLPVHLHDLYRERMGTGPGLCPVAEAAYDELLTLPLHAAMTDADVGDVQRAVDKVAHAARR